MATQTNSSLTTARRCPREYELKYELMIEPAQEEREVLAVGSTWHKAHDFKDVGKDPYEAIAKHAPSPAWREKLRRLFAAYDWYWQSQKFNVVHSEQTFKVTIAGREYEGQIDSIVKDDSGRFGIVERKTSGEDIGSTASYWDRLRMDTQVGIYAVAAQELFGITISFIIYDVVRKPTIRVKKIVKKDLERMKKEFAAGGPVKYYEDFTCDQVAEALELGVESFEMYGARLTVDIGENPEKYFGRREIPRTEDDMKELIENLNMQAEAIDAMTESRGFFRNPDACKTYGTCEFFALCSNNIPVVEGGAVPDGFKKREHRHVELVEVEGDQ